MLAEGRSHSTKICAMHADIYLHVQWVHAHARVISLRTYDTLCKTGQQFILTLAPVVPHRADLPLLECNN